MSTIDQLFSKAKAGDRSAENELFQYLSVRFRTIAKRRLGEDAAEDVAQAACVTVLEKYKNATFTDGFVQWAHGVLRNKVGNYYQGPKKRNQMESEINERQSSKRTELELDPVLKEDLRRCLEKILKKNQAYAEVLIWTYLGYKTEEICQKLSINPNNMYVMLNRCRKMLKSCLASGRVVDNV